VVRDKTKRCADDEDKRELSKHLLDEIIRRVVDVAHPDRIILFGSAARGEMTHGSDADMLVIKDGVKSRRTLEGKIYKSLIGVNLPVDVIVATKEDIEEARSQVGTIIRPALEEGVVVYDASSE